MSKRLMLVAVLVAALGPLVPAAEAAACSGGCGASSCVEFDWDAPHYEVGDLAAGAARRIYVGKYGESSPYGNVSDGPYFAYLSAREVLGGRPSSEGSHLLGQVQVGPFGVKSGCRGTAELSFTVPEVPPGDYAVEICNSSCDKRFGEMAADPLRIVSSDESGRILGRLDRLEARLDSSLAAMRGEARRRVTRLARELRGEIQMLGYELGGRIDDVEARVKELEERPVPAPSAESSETLSALAAGAALLVLMLMPTLRGLVFRGPLRRSGARSG